MLVDLLIKLFSTSSSTARFHLLLERHSVVYAIHHNLLLISPTLKHAIKTTSLPISLQDTQYFYCHLLATIRLSLHTICHHQALQCDPLSSISASLFDLLFSGLSEVRLRISECESRFMNRMPSATLSMDFCATYMYMYWPRARRSFIFFETKNNVLLLFEQHTKSYLFWSITKN